MRSDPETAFRIWEYPDPLSKSQAEPVGRGCESNTLDIPEALLRLANVRQLKQEGELRKFRTPEPGELIARKAVNCLS